MKWEWMAIFISNMTKHWKNRRYCTTVPCIQTTPSTLYLYWPVKFQTMQMAPGQKNKRIRPSKNTRLQPLGESFGPWQLLWAEGSKMIFLWITASVLGGAVLIGSMPSIPTYGGFLKIPSAKHSSLDKSGISRAVGHCWKSDEKLGLRENLLWSFWFAQILAQNHPFVTDLYGFLLGQRSKQGFLAEIVTQVVLKSRC